MKIRVPRWLGAAAIASGVLLIAQELAHLPYAFDGNFAAAATEPLYQVGSYLFLAGMVLLILGVAGVYAVNEKAFGTFGRVASGLAYVFVALMVGATWVIAFVEPTLALEAPELLDADTVAGPIIIGFMLSFIGGAVSLLLLAIAAFRAGVLSKYASGLVMAGAIWAAMPFATVGMSLLIGAGASEPAGEQLGHLRSGP